MRPADIELLHTVGNPVALHDGRIVVEVARPEVSTDSYLSQLFTFDADGTPLQKPQRTTHGRHDSGLQHTGGAGGFLRAARGAQAQLHVAVGAAEAFPLTAAALGVESFALHPTAAHAVWVARSPEPGRYGTDPDISAEAEAPRRITSAQYLANGLGYTTDRPARLFRAELTVPEFSSVGLIGSDDVPQAEALPVPANDVSDPQFSPSGAVLSVIAELPDASAVDTRSTVWIISDDTAAPLELGDLSIGRHCWIDEDTLLFTASARPGSATDFVAQTTGLHLYDRRTGRTRRLTDPEAVDLADIRPIPADDRVLAVAIEDGAQRLVEIALDSIGAGNHVSPDAQLRRLTPAYHVVDGAAVLPDGRIVYTAGTPTSTGELFLRTVDGAITQLSALQRLQSPVVPEPVQAASPLGQVHGWVALPEGSGPFPTILAIHGGPFSQFTCALLDEIQVLTGAGYAVVYCNPRGSNGRGHTWGAAVQGDLAEPAAADVLAVLEAAVERHPEIDVQRLGVQGGSYGGYLTAMLIGCDHRFAGAIVERGYLVPQSFIGTSDIGRYFTEEYTGWDPAEISRQSPLTRVAEVRTPTLVMHSELDLRCPFEQAQQYFAALQRAGVRTELLVFPGENHELSRSGRPRHRVQRFEAILDWWARVFAAVRN